MDDFDIYKEVKTEGCSKDVGRLYNWGVWGSVQCRKRAGHGKSSSSRHHTPTTRLPFSTLRTFNVERRGFCIASYFCH